MFKLGPQHTIGNIFKSKYQNWLTFSNWSRELRIMAKRVVKSQIGNLTPKQ
jgi:hypothetical protein